MSDLVGVVGGGAALFVVPVDVAQAQRYSKTQNPPAPIPAEAKVGSAVCVSVL